MATYYVETSRPAYPGNGIKVTVHAARDFSLDVISPDMTSVWQVDKVSSKPEAIAAVIEKAAGKGVCVSQMF